MTLAEHGDHHQIDDDHHNMGPYTQILKIYGAVRHTNHTNLLFCKKANWYKTNRR
jgi:hypothetical protein